MVGGIEWQNVNIAGAFVLGAVLATIATIRVVRAVSAIFEDGPRRRRHFHRDPEPKEK